MSIQEEGNYDNANDNYNQDGVGRGQGKKSRSDAVEPDDVGKSDEDDKDDEDDQDDQDDQVEGVSGMPEKENAARIDNVSSKL